MSANKTKKVTIMEWKEFIDQLLKDFRTTTYEVEKEYGISSAILSYIKTGKTAKPSQNTIRRLETAFSIEIDDSNPTDIRYTKLEPIIIQTNKSRVEVSLLEFPIFHIIPTKGELSNLNLSTFPEVTYFNYDKQAGCFAYSISEPCWLDGWLKKGDVLLADYNEPLNNGDICIAQLVDGKILVRRYQKIQEGIILLLAGEGELPISLTPPELKSIVRIVRIYKTV